MPNFCGERVGILGGQRRGARGDGADALQVVARQVGMQHRAQGRGHQRHRLRPVPAHGVGPPVELEAVQQRERPCLADALQDAEHAADVHQRGVDDRDAASQFGRRCRDAEIGADHAARQHVVGEVDSLWADPSFRWSASAPRPRRGRRPGSARRPRSRRARPRGPEIATVAVCAVGVTNVVRSSSVADDQRQIEATRCRP